MESKMMIENMDRGDSNVPLTKFGVPGVDMVKLREYMELPDQFLRACTLREGTWVVVVTLNAVAVALISYLSVLIICYKEETTDWWKERFRDDFDYYYRDENTDLIDSLYPLWLPFAYAIIGVKALYIMTGMMVIIALVLKNDAHPCCYLPWLSLTGILVVVIWLMTGAMILYILVMLTYRDVTVTWDVAPICCVIVYAVMWTYAWFVVIAHHRRRRIVRYWKHKQETQGTVFMGPQY